MYHSLDFSTPNIIIILLLIFSQLCGKTLEGEEKYTNVQDASQVDEEKAWSENPSPKMVVLISLVEPLASNEGMPEEIRSEIQAVLDTRKNNRWADAEAANARAKEAQAQAMIKAAPKKSNAIKIEVRTMVFLFTYQIGDIKIMHLSSMYLLPITLPLFPKPTLTKKLGLIQKNKYIYKFSK